MPDNTIRQQDFVHLHLHTEYSLLDGAARIDRLMQKVKSLGQTAVAITDHGVMYGCVDFYKAAKKHGVKPIIGCEVYVAQRSRHEKVHKIDSSSYHLILLCKNETGYKNLLKLVSLSNTEGFYVKPRIDHELLEQYHEGLIALSACLAGELPQALLAGDYEDAKEKALFYKNLFGEGNYYIELQDHGIEEQAEVLPGLIRLARDIDVPLVATNDCHYIDRADAEMQHVLICIQTNHTIDDEDVMEFKTDHFYVKSTEEMTDLFAAVPEAVANTAKIAEMCEFDYEFGVTKLPVFSTPDGSDNTEFFKKICFDGLEKYYGKNPEKEVADRLQYEMETIISMGYVDYFLIVWDFITYARNNDIPVGPGRGSGAGSLCAYCMGITGIDPIKFGLLFERFLNPERISMPDFDIDFCYEKRQMVIDYVVDKYGDDHVAQIITFGTMAARAAVRDVGRVLDIPYATVDTIAKLIPQQIGITIQDALVRVPELKALYDNDESAKRLLDLSIKVEGMPRHASTHAAGVVITQSEVSDYVPLQKNEEQIVTQFPMGTLEELGLLKMDFLGLRTLTVVNDTEHEIKKTNPDFSIEDIPDDDGPTFDMLAAGNTEGVFQFESAGMRQVLMGLRSVSIEDLIAVISLYRPGPMGSIPTYIENRHNPSHVRYKHPALKPILDVTYGCIVYQEQVMQIFRELGGFSYGQADIVRRAMSKKKHDIMEREGKNFIAGSVERGVPEGTAQSIYNDMADFASYAFNKSHAAAYALIAYQTAYLKCHYPVAFMAALLTSVLDNTDKVIEYFGECQRLGIEVLPPNINVSNMGFTVDGDAIRFGLLAVKNVGRNLIESIIKSRETDGPFVSFLDFCERMNNTELNKRALENLVKCGAFDSFGPSRKSMVVGMEDILKSIADDNRRNIEGQIDFFSQLGDVPKSEATLRDEGEYSQRELLAMEKDVTGLYLSSHPLMEYSEKISEISSCTVRQLLADDAQVFDNSFVDLLCSISSVRMRLTKSNATMANTIIEDLTGSMEMMVFPNKLEQYAPLLKVNNVVVVNARVSVKEDEAVKLICNDVYTVESYPGRGAKRFTNGNGNTRAYNAPPEAQQAVDNKKLYIKVPSRENGVFDRVTAILSIFDGATPVIIYDVAEKKKLQAPRRLWVTPGAVLETELKTLLGEENVKFQ